jgi:hypothetical protein
MRLLAEVVVMAMAVVAFCLLLAGFALVVRRGGWRPAPHLAAHGQWPLPRRLLLAGAVLGALSGVLMILLGVSTR